VITFAEAQNRGLVDKRLKMVKSLWYAAGICDDGKKRRRKKRGSERDFVSGMTKEKNSTDAERSNGKYTATSFNKEAKGEVEQIGKLKESWTVVRIPGEYINISETRQGAGAAADSSRRAGILRRERQRDSREGERTNLEG